MYVSAMKAFPVLAAAVLLFACADVSTNVAGELTYAQDAKGNYAAGLKDLKDHDYTDAVAYFEYVRNKFPYSHFAPLAELAIADANFEQEKYTEASDGYKNFIKDHPTNPKVDYAGFRIALAHYKDLPSDFFFIPPSYEKDQQQIVDTRDALKDFLANYPDSGYVKEARKMMAEVRKRLARHELYVARFYENHGHPKAALWRYQGLARDYRDTPYAEEADRRSARLAAQLGRAGERPPVESQPSKPASEAPPSSP